jgi:hypothetical protein
METSANYYVGIIKHIKFYAKYSHSEKEHSQCNILMHLVELLGEEEFNQEFKMYFIDGEQEFDDMFMEFHKSMRQTDFYSDCFKRVEIENKKFERKSITSHLDMIFWNFIHTNDMTYKIFKSYYEEVQEEKLKTV